MRQLALVSAVMACVLAVAPAGQSRGRGGITGNVASDDSRLPGVTVTIANSGGTRTVITNDAGRFDALDLPEGTYTLTAELQGFETVRQQDVIVGPGRISVVNFTLPLGCLYEVVYVDLGTSAAVQGAGVILHLRITGSGSQQRWDGSGGCFVGHEYSATPLRVLMSPPGQALTAGTVRLLESGPVHYRPGQEYVAFLGWDTDSGRFFAASISMFPVRDGRVVWTRTDTPTLRDGMSVEQFQAALQALLPSSRP